MFLSLGLAYSSQFTSSLNWPMESHWTTDSGHLFLSHPNLYLSLGALIAVYTAGSPQLLSCP